MNAVKIVARTADRTKAKGQTSVKLSARPCYRDETPIFAHAGVFLQRCGGGNRVIRKLIGSGN